MDWVHGECFYIQYMYSTVGSVSALMKISRRENLYKAGKQLEDKTEDMALTVCDVTACRVGPARETCQDYQWLEKNGDDYNSVRYGECFI